MHARNSSRPFHGFALAIAVSGLTALAVGMAAGWFAQIDSRTPVALDRNISVKSSGLEPVFSQSETTAMNRCFAKWKGVIDRVDIGLTSLPAEHDSGRIACDLVVASPANLVVMAKRVETRRANLVPSITAAMDRAGDALASLDGWPQFRGIKRIYI